MVRRALQELTWLNAADVRIPWPMKARFVLPMILGLLLAGCAGAPETDTYTHRAGFAGPDMDITLDNLLGSAEDRSYLIWLNAVRVRDGSWQSRHYLEVRYEGASDAGFIDIAPGETLIVTVDGETLRFRGLGSDATRHRTDRGTFVETALYETQPDTIRQIARGREIRVQVNGEARRLYREFGEENSQKFRAFVLTHMGGF
jgi:hypothetical protein